MKKILVLLLLGNLLFTFFTSLSDIREHLGHLSVVAIPTLLLLGYILQNKFRNIRLAPAKLFLNLFIVFSLGIFVSTHVVPSTMLMDHHDSASHTTEAHGQHACCIPALPATAFADLENVFVYVYDAAIEPKHIYSSQLVFNESSRAPPVV